MGKPALIFHLPILALFFPSPVSLSPPPPPLVFLAPFLLLLHPFFLSPSHFLSIFLSLPPTNYLQDYRFSVGCDWVSLGVMQALRCLLNGEHHELWTNYSHSSTTPESQAVTVSTHTHAHTHRNCFPQCKTTLVCNNKDTHIDHTYIRWHAHTWYDAHCRHNLISTDLKVPFYNLLSFCFCSFAFR